MEGRKKDLCGDRRSPWIVLLLCVTIFFARSHSVSRFFVVISPNPESSGLSFQLASLDETGVLNFWVSWATGWRFSLLFFFPCTPTHVKGISFIYKMID